MIPATLASRTLAPCLQRRLIRRRTARRSYSQSIRVRCPGLQHLVQLREQPLPHLLPSPARLPGRAAPPSVPAPGRWACAASACCCCQSCLSSGLGLSAAPAQPRLLPARLPGAPAGPLAPPAAPASLLRRLVPPCSIIACCCACCVRSSAACLLGRYAARPLSCGCSISVHPRPPGSHLALPSQSPKSIVLPR